MSAICGIYHQNSKPVCPETGVSMLDGFKQYHADDCGTWFNGPVFLGCHAQHITPESVNEKLPYHDEQADLVITADAIIDNRQELFDRLAIPHEDRRNMPDSFLILEAYKKWGKSCPKYLIGDFAFVIWDGRCREVFCAVDALGTRTLYYSQSTGIFAFSTLMKPLFVVAGIERKFNDIWIADFLTMPSVDHQLDPELTIYENIYLLPAGYMLTVGESGVVKSLYWQITRQPELKLSSDAEYEEAFRAIFSEAVRCRMRSIRPVGVMMSGGLDSTSVAGMAAKEISPRGARLQAFSAVPMAGYQDWLPASQIADETVYIEAVKQQLGNIDVVYCSSNGKHPLSDTEQLFDMLEHPYKIFENLFWIDSILATARNRNVGVMLNGAGGNETISWGDIDSYTVSLFRQGKWLSLLREAKAYSERKKNPFIKVLVRLLVNCMPYAFQKTIYRLRCGDKDDVGALSPVNADFAKHYQVAERFNQFGYDPLFIGMSDSFTCRQEMLNTTVSSHVSSINTKQSLAYCIALRDPTKDKRVIEFCLSLPENQYVRNGEERRLIRRAMAGILPEKVRLNENIRGKQSADWLQRIVPYWQEIVGEMNSIGKQEAERRYLDIAGIQRKVANMATPSGDLANDCTVRMLIRALIFYRFLRCEAEEIMKGDEKYAKKRMAKT